MLPPTTDDDHPLAERFRDFVRDPDFPCVGAKSALSKGQMRIVVARDIRSGWDDLRIYPGLLDLAKSYADDPVLFQTFVVVFEQDWALSEASFETAIWARIQSLTDKDAMFAQAPDRRVSSDPGDPHFSLSFGGQAFFVVGLHPGASRPSAAVQPASDGVQPARSIRAAARAGSLRKAAWGDPRSRHCGGRHDQPDAGAARRAIRSAAV